MILQKVLLMELTNFLYQEKLDSKDINQIVHGTTLVTNTLIERTGAKVGLLVLKVLKIY